MSDVPCSQRQIDRFQIRHMLVDVTTHIRSKKVELVGDGVPCPRCNQISERRKYKPGYSTNGNPDWFWDYCPNPECLTTMIPNADDPYGSGAPNWFPVAARSAPEESSNEPWDGVFDIDRVVDEGTR